jgi:hypothetical protein
LHLGPPEIGLLELSFVEQGALKLRLSQVRLLQMCLHELSAAEVGFVERGPA